MNPAAPRPGSPQVGDRLAPGTHLSRKVRIDGLLGEGGMATVYRGHHLLLDEPVAVKVMRRELTGMKEVVARFLREARAAAKVRSEHAVIVYDVDELEGGQPYMLMELLDGEDLAARTDRLGRIPMDAAVSYILQACVGVRVAHDAGIVHRDIKPANLFVSRNRAGIETVKVLDFGISKLMQELRPGGAAPLTSITRIGSILGSPRYMAPEQMVDARNVDRRADVWSLACTLYTLLHGRPAFEGDTIHVICANVLTKMPAPLHPLVAGVPAELDAVLARAMAKSRDDRHADVGELARELAPFAVAAARPDAAMTAPRSSVAVSEELSTPRMAERQVDVPTTRLLDAPIAPIGPRLGRPGEEPASPARQHGHASRAAAPTMMSSGLPMPSPAVVPPSTFDGMRAPDLTVAPVASGRRWPLFAALTVAFVAVASVGVWRLRTPAPPAAAGASPASSAASPVESADSADSAVEAAPRPSSSTPPGASGSAATSVPAPLPASPTSPTSANPTSRRRAPEASGPARGPEPQLPSPHLPDPFAGEQK